MIGLDILEQGTNISANGRMIQYVNMTDDSSVMCINTALALSGKPMLYFP
jgi:hypothetical protein